jgi:hypothetical protein
MRQAHLIGARGERRLEGVPFRAARGEGPRSPIRACARRGSTVSLTHRVGGRPHVESW